MQFEEYQRHLAALKQGKRLPTAVYVFREADTDFGRELNPLLTRLAIQHGLDEKFNVLKFRTDELKISFLCYPDFLTVAHPPLRHAVTLDLVTGRARRTDYADNHNPPILHRKETFLPATHPRREEFAALTRAEEGEGLYEHPATIGFKLNWERLLRERGLRIEGHQLKRRPAYADAPARQGRGKEVGGRRSEAGQGDEPQRHGDTEGAKGEGQAANIQHSTFNIQHRTTIGQGPASELQDQRSEIGSPPFVTLGAQDVLQAAQCLCAFVVLPPPPVSPLSAHSSDLRLPASDLCCPRPVVRSPTSDLRSPVFERHKTAMTRYDLSKPVKTLLEYGLLKTGATFFDYGCGQGSDVRGLQALGHAAEGWDPVHRPEVAKREADIVNLGYVLNVIEDPAERLEALVDAYRHARRLLVVSGLIQETVATERATQYGDGIVTQRNTFQKFFEQSELQQYVEDALDTTAVPVALGVFYVFRDPAEQQDFLSARSRRAIDWTQISARLGLGGPRTLWKALYDAHKELLDGFGKMALALGRFPAQPEFDRLPEVEGLLGSAEWTFTPAAFVGKIAHGRELH